MTFQAHGIPWNKGKQQLSNEERFWSHVVKEPYPNGCWRWNGSSMMPYTPKRLIMRDKSRRYGFFKLSVPERKTVLAHRYAWEITYGPLLPMFQVLHKCDTPTCVRPSHLFIGTHDDNHRDCTTKGRRRGQPGELNPSARLTEAMVHRIHELRAQGVSWRAIATKLDQSYACVKAAGTGRNWAYLYPSPPPSESLISPCFLP